MRVLMRNVGPGLARQDEALSVKIAKRFLTDGVSSGN